MHTCVIAFQSLHILHGDNFPDQEMGVWIMDTIFRNLSSNITIAQVFTTCVNVGLYLVPKSV